VSDARLHRSQFGLHRIDDAGGAVEFHLPHGPMLRLLRDCCLELEDLVEVQAPEEGATAFDHVDLAWARQWPCEEVWKARRTSR
jgi:hypothetical protein